MMANANQENSSLVGSHPSRKPNYLDDIVS